MAHKSKPADHVPIRSGMTRRQFLKTSGAGAAGVGAVMLGANGVVRARGAPSPVEVEVFAVEGADGDIPAKGQATDVQAGYLRDDNAHFETTVAPLLNQGKTVWVETSWQMITKIAAVLDDTTLLLEDDIISATGESYFVSPFVRPHIDGLIWDYEPKLHICTRDAAEIQAAVAGVDTEDSSFRVFHYTSHKTRTFWYAQDPTRRANNDPDHPRYNPSLVPSVFEGTTNPNHGNNYAGAERVVLKHTETPFNFGSQLIQYAWDVEVDWNVEISGEVDENNEPLTTIYNGAGCFGVNWAWSPVVNHVKISNIKSIGASVFFCGAYGGFDWLLGPSSPMHVELDNIHVVGLRRPAAQDSLICFYGHNAGSWVCTNCVIEQVDHGPALDFAIVFKGLGINNFLHTDVVILDNRIVECHGSAIACIDSGLNHGGEGPITNAWIAGNTVEASGGAAISIMAVDAVVGPAEVFDNWIYAGPVGIECFGDGSRITGNHLVGAFEEGIRLGGSGNRVESNLFSESTFEYASVSLYGYSDMGMQTAGNTIAGNEIGMLDLGTHEWGTGVALFGDTTTGNTIAGQDYTKSDLQGWLISSVGIVQSGSVFADGLPTGNIIDESNFALGTVCTQVLDLSSRPDHRLGDNIIEGLDTCNLEQFAHLAHMMRQYYDWLANKERIADRQAAHNSWPDEARLARGLKPGLSR